MTLRVVASYYGLLILLVMLMQLNVQLYGATATFCAEQSLVASLLFCRYINVHLYPECIIIDILVPF